MTKKKAASCDCSHSRCRCLYNRKCFILIVISTLFRMNLAVTESHEQVARLQVMKISKQIRQWQIETQTSKNTTCTSSRLRLPFITLTFAQSLDGRMAISATERNHPPLPSTMSSGPTNITSSSRNLPLSGPESLIMTHSLRSIHDAILIGGRTLEIDNPRLTNRLWKSNDIEESRTSESLNPPLEEYHQPRPVVLDTNLQSLRRLLRNPSATIRAAAVKNCTANWKNSSRRLIVCCSHDTCEQLRHEPDKEKITSLVTLLPCTCYKDSTTQKMMLDLFDVVKQLQDQFDIQSIMVEGGATVLSAFLNAKQDQVMSTDSTKASLVDCICITIAPKLIGDCYGIPPFEMVPGPSGTMMDIGKKKDTLLAKNSASQFISLGNDCVFLTQLKN